MTSTLMRAGGRDEMMLFYRNQPQATKTACLHLAAGTGENAQATTSRELVGAFCH